MFFLQSRSQQIKKKLQQAEKGINLLKTKIAANPASEETEKVREGLNRYGQPIAQTIQRHNDNMFKLNIATKSFSGYVKSFFCPWSAQFRYRKEAAKSVSVIEKNFHQLTLFASECGEFSNPKQTPDNMTTSISASPPTELSIKNYMKKKA
jgi:hypothetical protein